MTKPFTGVKILDFTRVLAGPYGSYQLALLGADVIKVESRDGDDMRYGNRANDWEKRGLAAPWVAVNAGKRSITLDLKKPKAIEVVKRLAAKADVVMENFRPGVMDKLGIGYETLKAINPRLIYCAVSGFGQVGPERATAAFDGMIQAMSGLMSITGFPDQRPDARGLRRRRRDVGRDGGLRRSLGPVPAHPHRQGPARRRRHDRRGDGLSGAAIHRAPDDRPRARAGGQPVGHAQADRRSTTGPGTAGWCSPS